MRGTPLGGTHSDWGRRLLRSHLPVGAAAGLLLVLFMTVPTFDPQPYPQVDMGSASALPRGGETGMGAGHGATQEPTSGHGGGATVSPGAHGGATSAPGHGERASRGTHGADRTPDPTADRSNDDRAARVSAQRFTVATGYVATGLLGVTLLIGPANLLFRRRNPVSSYLRRDVGMWTALFSVIHVIYGSLLHSGGELAGVLRYFLAPDGRPLLSSFGLGNWTGLAATLIVLGLLAISSDLALRTLKAGRWKWLQRLNYALFALVIAHAFFYGAFLRTTSPFTMLLAITVIAVLAAQTAGVWLWRRRRHARSTASAA